MDRWTFYPNPWASQQTAIRKLTKDEKRKAEINWRSYLDSEASEISSVEWKQRNSGTIEITSESNDGVITSAFLKGLTDGRDKIACRVTLNDGQVLDFRLDISVRDASLD